MQRGAKGSLQTATWNVALADLHGTALGDASHVATLPGEARDSAYEAALVAAVTSKLPQVRSWLATLAKVAP